MTKSFEIKTYPCNIELWVTLNKDTQLFSLYHSGDDYPDYDNTEEVKEIRADLVDDTMLDVTDHFGFMELGEEFVMSMREKLLGALCNQYNF